MWEDMVRAWIPLWISVPEGCKRTKKWQGLPLLILVFKLLCRYFKNLKIYLIQDTGGIYPKPTHWGFCLVKQFSKLLKGKKRVLIHSQRGQSYIFGTKNVIKQSNMETIQWMRTNWKAPIFKLKWKSKAKEHEKTLSKYDNDSKEKTSSTPDKEEEKSVNVLNVLLNIYECVKNIFQWMYKCAWTALEQIFYCILDWKSQSTISLGLFRFIHNYILYFCYVRKYHLDMNDIYFKAVNITKK